MTEYVKQTFVGLMAHDIEHMTASVAPITHGNVVVIYATGPNQRRVVDFTLFFDDAGVASDLAAAINGVFANRAKQAA
jgi:hypothetical protein